ncbi:MAG: formylmethanofuran dehydrogenase subunit C [Candidatus Heimdallarchaeota archaeon]
MPEIVLTLKTPVINPQIPIEADSISPDNFLNKTLEEIAELSLYRGNRKLTLQEIFTITGDEKVGDKIEEITIILEGKLDLIKRVGQEMSQGQIIINSSIGMHTGFKMSGGTITVNGNADDFAGANIKGGELIIKGNAGHYLGGSVRGDWRGMSGGKITVAGNVGNESGVWMRKGIIEIAGNAPMFLGMHMHRGLIIIKGDVEERLGAEMTGGVIVVKGKLHKILPSFEFVKNVTDIEIENYGVIKGSYLIFKGDFAERKQGFLYLDEKKNSYML